MANAFSETNNLFREYLQYTKSYSYPEWLALGQDKKAAALFVQFYEQITLAWFNAKSFYTLEEDGVACMMQYLMKNVPIIEANPNRFNPKYIYRVAYNCLYCICHDIKRDRHRYDNEISNIVGYGEDELDLFETVQSGFDFDDELQKRYFWSVVNSLDPKAQKVMNHLLNEESLRRVSKSSPKYSVDPLSEVGVKLDEVESILADIRVKLAKFRNMI